MWLVPLMPVPPPCILKAAVFPPLTSRPTAASSVVPTLIPTLSPDTSTSKVSVSTAKSSVTVALLLNVASPETLNVDPTPVILNDPDMLSPALRTLREAEPVRFAVIVPAEKLPEASLLTAVLATLVDWNSILPEFQTTLPLILKPSAFATKQFRVPEPSVALPPVATKPTL